MLNLQMLFTQTCSCSGERYCILREEFIVVVVLRLKYGSLGEEFIVVVVLRLKYGSLV